MEGNQEYLIVARDQGIVFGGLIQPFVVTRQWLNQVPEWRYGEYSVYVNGLTTKAEADAKLDNGQPWHKS